MNKSPKRRPQRKCVGCGAIRDKNELIRIVRTPEPAGDTGNTTSAPRIEIDSRGKMSGRGAYICKSEDCLNKAAKSGRLARSLEHPVSGDIYEALRQRLATTPPAEA